MARTHKTLLLKVLLALSLWPSLSGISSYYYSMTPIKGGRIALSSFCTVALDIDPNITSAINGGSVSDGDAVSSYVERSANGDTWSESGTNRLTWKQNIINGRGVFRVDPTAGQRLKSSARQLLTAGSAFTIIADVYLNSFDQAYKYFGSFKGASGSASPSIAFSTNASYKDLYFGADVTWMVNRWTTISSITGAWKLIIVRYTGGTATSGSSYEAYSGSSQLTRTGTSGNDGDATYNLVGAYKTASNPYGWNGDIGRFVVCSNDIGSSGVTTAAAWNLQEYNF